MLRGHEGLQGQGRPDPPVPPRQEHGALQQVVGPHRPAQLQLHRPHRPDRRVRQAREPLHPRGARLLAVPAPDHDRHPKDAGRRPARVRSSLCHCLARRPLLPDRIQGHLARGDRLRGARVARRRGRQEAGRQLRAVHRAPARGHEPRLPAESVAVWRGGVLHRGRHHELVRCHGQQADGPEGAAHGPARRHYPQWRHARLGAIAGARAARPRGMEHCGAQVYHGGGGRSGERGPAD